MLKCHQKYKQSTVILLDKQIDLFLKSIMVYNMKSCFFKKDRIGKRLIQLLSTSTFVGLYKTWFASYKLTFSTCLTSTKKNKIETSFQKAVTQVINSEGRTTFYQTSYESNITFRTSNELKHLNLALNKRTSNLKGLTKSFIKQTGTSFFQISNGLEHVHLLAIELKHPIFGLEQSHVELWT